MIWPFDQKNQPLCGAHLDVSFVSSSLDVSFVVADQHPSQHMVDINTNNENRRNTTHLCESKVKRLLQWFKSQAILELIELLELYVEMEMTTMELNSNRFLKSGKPKGISIWFTIGPHTF